MIANLEFDITDLCINDGADVGVNSYNVQQRQIAVSLKLGCQGLHATQLLLLGHKMMDILMKHALIL